MKRNLYPLLKVKVMPDVFFPPADSAKPFPFAVLRYNVNLAIPFISCASLIR